ncbi:MAG: hypothetical protein FWD47_07060 [Treponema sp.]|nr:hypothetical protein [Treponema sp.]
MKNFHILFLIVICLFFDCKTNEIEKNDYSNELWHFSWIFKPGEYYLLSDTFIYDHPNFESNKIGNINIHEKILVIENVHNQQKIDDTTSCWYKINYNNIEGYIFGANIAIKTLICDIGGNGINDYFHYRISAAAANFHLDTRKDVIIYINNERIIIGDSLSSDENEFGYRGYFFNWCSFEKIGNEVIITLSGTGHLNREDYIFSVNESGFISFIDHEKKGRFFENGQWVDYNDFDPYFN